MTHKRLLSLALMVIVMAACTNSETKDLAGKKKQLSELKTQQRDLVEKISKLEKDIAKMDTSVHLESKTKLVGVDTLKPTPFNHFVEVQGAVDAADNVLVIQQMPGVVTAIHVKEGDHVSKGMVLYETDATTYDKQTSILQTQLTLATTAFEKQEGLWKQNIGSEIQFLQSKANKEALEKQMGQLRATIELSKAKSPIDGVVDEVRIKLGDMAAPSQAMPGVRVVNSSHLVVKAKLSDAQIGLLEVGNTVNVNFPDINKTIQSKVSFVGQVVDKQTRTFNVEVKLENKDVNIKANMIAKLLINDETKNAVIVVPTNTVQQGDNGESYVLAVENNTAVKKVVETGTSYDGKTMIMKGLNAGDKVITFGYSEVVDGQKISY